MKPALMSICIFPRNEGLDEDDSNNDNDVDDDVMMMMMMMMIKLMTIMV